MNRCLYIILLCVCAFFKSYAGEVPLRHFTTDDGLPSNTVYEIYRDSKGYLWFATDKGAARYNGARFDVFTTFNGLPDNEIFFFREDAEERIWLGTYNGELCYFKNDTFHNAVNTPFLKLPIKTSFIKYIVPEKDGSVIMGFYDTQAFVEVKGETSKMVMLNNLKYRSTGKYEPFQRIGNVKKVNDSSYLVPGIRHTLVINNKGEILSATPSGVDTNAKYAFVFDRQNRFYYLTDSGFYSTDLRLKKKLGAAFLKNNFPYRILEEKGLSFLATSRGLIIGDTASTAVTFEHVLLPGKKVSGIEYDGADNYWISTLGDGVYAMPLFFNNYNIIDNAYPAVAAYAKSAKGHTYFTTEPGNLYEVKAGQVSAIVDYEHVTGTQCPDGQQPGFLITDDFKYYNVCGHQLVTVDNLLESGTAHVLSNSCINGGVKNIVDVGNVLYVQARERIDKLSFTALNGAAHQVDCSNIRSDSYESPRIFDFDKDDNENLWYSTVDRIYKLVDDESVWQKQFGNIAFKKFIFFHGKILGYTHSNVLLYCTTVNGNVRMDTINAQNCIWENFYKLDANHVLISTNREYRIFTIGDDNGYSTNPLENAYVPEKAEAISSDGTNCYFFKDGSIHRILVSELFRSAPRPRVFFTTVKTNSGIYSAMQALKLSYKESRTLRISFSALSFNGSHVTYQYSISDNSSADNWTDIKGEDINLVNLGFGDHRVKVRAKTIASDYSYAQLLVLHVERPFWAMWWFIILMLVSALSGVWLLVRRRITIEVKAREREHETNVRFLKSEYKALNALMNPHFIFNTLNNVQGLVNRDDKRAANEYLRIFADLIRQNMHNVASDLIPIEKEIALVSNYLVLEKLRFKEKLHYSILIDPDVDITEIMIPPLLIQPLVENAIKHGIFPMDSEDGKIELIVRNIEHVLHIYVRNNGIRISPTKRNSAHKSFALKNIRERIEKLGVIQNKKITFEIYEEVEDVIWTVVLLRIPLL